MSELLAAADAEADFSASMLGPFGVGFAERPASLPRAVTSSRAIPVRRCDGAPPPASSVQTEETSELLRSFGPKRPSGEGARTRASRVLLQYWPAEEPGPTPQQIEADPYDYHAARVFRYGVLEVATGGFVPVTAIPPGAAINDSPLSLDGVTMVQAYPEDGASTGAGTKLLSIAGDGSVAKRLSAGIAGELAMIGRLRSAAR